MTDSPRGATPPPAERADWKPLVARFQIPDARRAIWQLVNSVGSYIAVWTAMFLTLGTSWLLTALLVLLAGGLLVRVFIIFHDCGHGSFFASERANGFWGRVTGLLTFTPYLKWRHEHAVHHGSTGNLDRRGVGDVWTMTVNEYLAASRSQRFAYRLFRNPAVILGLAPLFMFLVENRIPKSGTRGWQRRSVLWTNLQLAVVLGLATWAMGPAFLLLQIAVVGVAATIGVWLFYVQHQFEDAYWRRGGEWNYFDAAVQGSTWLRLPPVLQWFTGNIGYHHIHHLSARIPNYHLQRCHESHPAFREGPSLTVWGSFRTLGLALFDEAAQKLVSFRELRRARRAPAAAGLSQDSA